ncbi:hypothetical protein BH23PLA1_BH23PLA1_20040 [soil metagenome]
MPILNFPGFLQGRKFLSKEFFPRLFTWYRSTADPIQVGN